MTGAVCPFPCSLKRAGASESRYLTATTGEAPAGQILFSHVPTHVPGLACFRTSQSSHVLLLRHDSHCRLPACLPYPPFPAFNRENELRPHDVLWLSAGEPHGQQLLFGVWRWGSPEAAAFKAHLGSGKPGSGKKRTRAQMLQDVAAAAAAAGNGGGAGPSEEEEQPKRQQKQQKTGSTSSSEDVPLYSPPQRPAGARALSPATAKAAIEELFEDDDG